MVDFVYHCLSFILKFYRIVCESESIYFEVLSNCMWKYRFKTFRLVWKTYKSYIFQHCATFVQIDNANHRCLLLWLRFLWFYLSNALFVRVPPFFKLVKMSDFNWFLSIWIIPSCQEDLYLWNGVNNFKIDNAKLWCYY